MITFWRRGVVQLAERTHGVREAPGAAPGTPTISIQMITDTYPPFLEKILSGLNDKKVDVTNMEMDPTGYQTAIFHLKPVLEIVNATKK